MRIRWRLALYGAFVAFVTMIVFTVLLTALVRRSAPQEQIETLAERAEAIAQDTAETPFAAFDSPSPIATVDPSTSAEQFFVIIDEIGRELLSSGVLNGRTPPVVPDLEIIDAVARDPAGGLVAIEGVEIRTMVRPWVNTGEGNRGYVVVGQSSLFVDQRLEEIGAVLVVATVITLLVSLVVGWFVSRRALRPLRRLAETTDAIAATADLSQRIPEVKHKDEVGALTRSFNGMLERLDEAQSRLAESLDTQQQFVADASHELRSPLTTIRNNAGFLIDRSDVSPDDRQEAITDISDEADRMANLVDDLLTLARSDAGAVVGSDPVDLVEVVGSVVRHVGGDAVTVAAPASAVVRGDRAALHRLVRTLVDNAVKHGGGTADVTVTQRPGMIRLAVADRGPGFPPGDLVKVFDRFYRADPARTATGTGLGMAIAKGIVTAHRGTILAANRPGGGAVIEADLPTT